MRRGWPLAAFLAAAMSWAVPAGTAAQSDSTRSCGHRWCVHVDVFAGAGFVGIRADQLVELPAWTTVNGQAMLDTTRSVYQVTRAREWKPALSSGIVIGLWGERGIGAGIGGHVLFASDDEGRARPYPAATIHVGATDRQIYGGIVWMPQDELRLPGGANVVFLPPHQPPERFRVRGGGTAIGFYFGLRIAAGGLDGSH